VNEKEVVAEREADLFSFFQAQRKAHVHLLLRLHQPRAVEILHFSPVCKLTQGSGRTGQFCSHQIAWYKDHSTGSGEILLCQSRGSEVSP
jgi:hypothetical protein